MFKVDVDEAQSVRFVVKRAMWAFGRKRGLVLREERVLCKFI
jgi:hypothetical protein